MVLSNCTKYSHAPVSALFRASRLPISPNVALTINIFSNIRHRSYLKIPYMPLTFNFFPQKCPFLREPAIFRGGDPSHSIPRPQKPLGGSHFYGGHGHGSGAKRQKPGWKVFKKKVELSTFFFQNAIPPPKMTLEGSIWAQNVPKN